MQMYGYGTIKSSFNTLMDKYVAFCEELENLHCVWKDFDSYTEDTDLELQDVDPQEFEDILNGG